MAAKPQGWWAARAATAVGFWTKLNEDWIFNFAGMLAFNVLTATAPLALVALAVAGLALSSLSPDTLTAYADAIGSLLPGGQQLMLTALEALQSGAGALLVIAVISALYGGSRLFIALENCFSVIYRLRDRHLVPQNLVAIGMTLLYAIFAPLAFAASGLLSNLFGFLDLTGSPAAASDVSSYLQRLTAGVVVAFVFYFTIYLFVPHRGRDARRRWREVVGVAWRGALAAAVLMVLLQQLFPLYRRLFLHGSAQNSIVGLAIVIVIFLYFAGFITLLGAEINAWSEGLRPLGANLPDLFRQRQSAETGEPSAAPPASPASPRATEAEWPENQRLPSDGGLPSTG
jgi:uncharacterized BrkB/YihY/UPF0761 family membrane protein